MPFIAPRDHAGGSLLGVGAWRRDNFYGYQGEKSFLWAAIRGFFLERPASDKLAVLVLGKSDGSSSWRSGNNTVCVV